MHILVADSGSTKTDWLFHNTTDHTTLAFQSSGLNPCLMDDDEILRKLTTEVRPHFSESFFVSASENSAEKVKTEAKTSENFTLNVYFYGAGCRPDQTKRMSDLLADALGAEVKIVASDLLGAARALCGDEAGIVAILGTGSGSAVFDGQRFTQQTPSLGFILGDEGSGAVLGRRLLGDIFKRQLPERIIRDFETQFGTTVDEAIRCVYREPNANRYLAHFVPFLEAHLDEPSVELLVVNAFRSFFERNILPYRRPDLSVNFVGSISDIYRRQLQKAAAECYCTVGNIIRSPGQGILEYHLAHIS